MIKNILVLVSFLLLLLLLLPSSLRSQTRIKGTINFYDTKEPVPGCVIYLIDTIAKTNIEPSRIKEKAQSNFDGNFEISNTEQSSNLIIKFRSYRNTIIKNIPHQDTTVFLKNIPLFFKDELVKETRVTSLKKRKSLKMEHNQIGNEGPFSYKNELIIDCESNSKHKVKCRKTRFGIEIDYQEFNKCDNHTYKK